MSDPGRPMDAVGVDAVRQAIALITASGNEAATRAVLDAVWASDDPDAAMRALAMFSDLLLDLVVGLLREKGGDAATLDKATIMQRFAIQIAEHARRERPPEGDSS